MIRLAPILVTAILVSACDRAPAPRAERATPTTAGFDNSAASQSIMQPKVIAESPPEPDPTPSPPPPPPEGATVLFPKGTKLDEAARTEIDRLIGDPALPPDARLVLRGHSDSPGSDQANLKVSRRRAQAVADYLRAKGVAADRLSVVPLGERRPAAPNAALDGSDDPAGRQRNRRVDIEVVDASPPVPEPGPVNEPAPTPSATASPAAR